MAPLPLGAYTVPLATYVSFFTTRWLFWYGKKRFSVTYSVCGSW